MPVNFKWGDVTNKNTLAGDWVVYITGPERGHWGQKRTHYQVVEIVSYEGKRIKIKFLSGSETYVTANHLFRIESMKKYQFKDEQDVNIVGLSVSARAARQPDGSYATVILNLDNGKEQIVSSFEGPGKMKNAKKLASQISGL